MEDLPPWHQFSAPSLPCSMQQAPIYDIIQENAAAESLEDSSVREYAPWTLGVSNAGALDPFIQALKDYGSRVRWMPFER